MDIRIQNLVLPVGRGGIHHEDPLRKPPLPKQASVKNLSDQSQNHLLYEGRSIKSVILEAAKHNPQLLSQIANELKKLKDRLENQKYRPHNTLPFTFFTETDDDQMIALCEIYLGLIAEKLKLRYNRTQSGLDAEVDEEGHLILNGINVTLLIMQCRRHLTSASRIYLKGVGLRLALLTGKWSDASVNDKMGGLIQAHRMSIDDLLRNSPDASQYASF